MDTTPDPAIARLLARIAELEAALADERRWAEAWKATSKRLYHELYPATDNAPKEQKPT
jgi:hypothetical protein